MASGTASPPSGGAANVTGVVLAAGAGTRAGGPKALLRLEDETPWLEVATTALLDGGCGHVVVVLGAMARLARPLVPVDPRIEVMVAERWEDGMSASLRAGLAAVGRGLGASRLAPSVSQDNVLTNGETGADALPATSLDRPRMTAADAVLVTLVDLPELPLAVVERIAAGATRESLRQAIFGGRPGHPVLIGADHWAAVAATLEGDHGARHYLVAHGVQEIECSDLWDGLDRDAG
jgi:CTP:molybdopterin cytidylyltransferase MocA